MACIDLANSRYNALLDALVASFPMPGTMDVFLQTRSGRASTRTSAVGAPG
ncbi:hypothetical protein [Rubrivirga sp. SAORIC476]|uniref:hypothetical protein n=1 Tax=Rubrivirga sp. SAORIC476 TaxID=1961794 RepID=UPI0013042FE9|nr:hypothetical protein [Rubrivirga sp. SAORIC476]